MFDPNGPGIAGKLFGLPHTEADASVVVVPVPWEVTVSYKDGTAQAPANILKASQQVDLFVRNIPDAWKSGIALAGIPENILQHNNRYRSLALMHLRSLEAGEVEEKIVVDKVNEASESLNIYLKNRTRQLLDQGKLVGILGGDHSVPLGFLQALSERTDRFGVLQVDAHHDFRKAYEGFRFSHASIMYNALKLPSISKIVQVGIRDYCEEEADVVTRAGARVKVFYDEDIHHDLDHNKSWSEICKEIVNELPPLVYISFDIDGLDPALCPNTGTPVPGGLDFHMASVLLQTLAESSKKIIGFDLCEVGSSDHTDWDANVGARILYQLCNYLGVTNGKLRVNAPN